MVYKKTFSETFTWFNPHNCSATGDMSPGDNEWMALFCFVLGEAVNGLSLPSRCPFFGWDLIVLLGF